MREKTMNANPPVATDPESAPLSGPGESAEALRAAVRERYAAAARGVAGGGQASCGCGCGAAGGPDPISSGLYGAEESAALPPQALAASLGCGNPTALLDLHPGEVVLDLGSGGGIDVLLSARRV